MSAALAHVRRLESWLQEEIAAQTKARELLETQLGALQSRTPEPLIESTNALERALSGSVDRGRRREEILRQLAREWGVAASSLSLSSICERLRSASARESEIVQRLAGELRVLAQQVRSLARRAFALSRAHQRLLADVIQQLFAGVGAENAAQGGQLLDAEA